MNKSFAIGERFAALLHKEGVLTEEQWHRTTSITLVAKAGEAVRFQVEMLAPIYQLEALAKFIADEPDAKETQ